MRKLLILLTICLASGQGAPVRGEGVGILSTGRLHLEFDSQLLAELGSSPVDTVQLQSKAGGAIDISVVDGRFQHLIGGSSRFGGGPRLGSLLDLSTTRLEVASEREFMLRTASGLAAFRIQMGQFTMDPSPGGMLKGVHFDLRVTPELAHVHGTPGLAGRWAGSAHLYLQVSTQQDAFALGDSPLNKGQSSICETPVWPTEDGAEADLAMIDIPNVDVRAATTDGFFTITPSAVFRNVGTADIPWFQVFASPENDPQYCLDDGTGACQPYGNDQQGLLVWNLYRLKDGILRQVGASGVKHAFNSVNQNCTLSADCGSGRIAWRGCEDLYSAGTNNRNDFLGPRDEIQARSVRIERCGSVFDSDCDDECDNPSAGFVRCLASTPPESMLDSRKLVIPEYMLSDPTARYFLETWYLVRDDIDIRNSMGHVEIEFSPSGISGWTAPQTEDFVQGPVLSNPLFASHTSDISSDFGEAVFLASVEPANDGRYRYSYSLMNFTVDKGFDLIQLRFPTSDVDKIAFRNASLATTDDWHLDLQPEVIAWIATPGGQLRWGQMISMSFESSLAPVEGSIIMRIADKPSPDSIRVLAVRPAAAAGILAATGFEGEMVTTTVFLTTD